MSALEEYFENLSLESLIDYKRKCDEKYYNNVDGDNDCVADDVYDILEEVIRKKSYVKDSKAAITTVGAKTKTNQIKLPFYMGSMNKLKTPKEIMKWTNKYSTAPCIIQEKLDGVSCLVLYDNDCSISLFTRGDGTIGSNISHLVPFLSSLPKFKSSLVIRGELIMSKEIFNSKYSSSYSNSRNLVSGIVNSTINIKEDIANDIDFVAYEIIDDYNVLKPSEQLEKLRNVGFEVAQNQIVDSIDVEKLTELLLLFKQTS